MSAVIGTGARRYFRNSTIAAVVAVGLSICGKCPALGINIF
jgi:hypothetical protein